MVSLVVLSLALLLAIVSTRYLSSSSQVQDSRRTLSTSLNSKRRMDTVRPIAGVKRVMVFGGTGMVGRGVMNECLRDPEVEEVVAVGRRSVGIVHDKLREIQHSDLLNFDALDEEMKNVDACVYAVGVSSADVDKPTYEKITKDSTLAAANALIRHNPNMTFVLISAMGADATSSKHWPRIKGETENAIIDMPWHGYAFRPGMIRSMNGEESQTKAYRWGYTVLAPIVALTHWIAPSLLTTTETIGQGFLQLAKHGSGTEQRIFENNEINLITKPKK